MPKTNLWKVILALVLALTIGGCSKGKEEKGKRPPPSRASSLQTPGKEGTPPSPSRLPTMETQNTPPQIVDIHLSPSMPVTGDRIKAIVKVDEAHEGNTTLEFTWLVNGEPVDNPGPILEYNVKRGDRVEVKVTAVSGSLKSKTVAATTVVGNAPPILKLKDQKVIGNKYMALLEVTDPEGDPVTLELKKAPPGMVIDQGKKSLIWNLPNLESGKTFHYDIEVSAKDIQGAEAILMFPLNIEVKNVASPKK